MDPDNSFVNFISLAESVDLAPTADLWISFELLSLSMVEDLVSLTAELVFALPLFWSFSYMQEEYKVIANNFSICFNLNNYYMMAKKNINLS